MEQFAHYLGAAGECANFAGAVLLAYDVFSRRSIERAERIAVIFGDRTKGALDLVLPPVSQPITVGGKNDPTAEIEHLHILAVTKLSQIGIIALAIGFALLIAYHILSII